MDIYAILFPHLLSRLLFDFWRNIYFYYSWLKTLSCYELNKAWNISFDILPTYKLTFLHNLSKFTKAYVNQSINQPFNRSGFVIRWPLEDVSGIVLGCWLRNSTSGWFLNYRILVTIELFGKQSLQFLC